MRNFKKPFFLTELLRKCRNSEAAARVVLYKKAVIRNFTKFTGKHLFQSIFFNKVAGPRPATLFKKRLWYRCFPVNFVKFPRTPYLQNASGRLLLEILKTITQQNTATQLMQEFSKLIITGLSYFHLLSMKIIDLVSSKIKFHPN